MITADLMKILLAPRVTEKTSVGGTDEQPLYSFKVHKKASKPQILAAVEEAFGVKVAHVRTVNYKGKRTRFGKTLGKHADWKKAYVRLQKGHDLDMVKSEG